MALQISYVLVVHPPVPQRPHAGLTPQLGQYVLRESFGESKGCPLSRRMNNELPSEDQERNSFEVMNDILKPPFLVYFQAFYLYLRNWQCDLSTMCGSTSAVCSSRDMP